VALINIGRPLPKSRLLESGFFVAPQSLHGADILRDGGMIHFAWG